MCVFAVFLICIFIYIYVCVCVCVCVFIYVSLYIFTIYMCLCEYIYAYKLATVVEGDSKAPFLIDNTPICKEGRYSFPWIAPLYP